jgi:hypothetical protein
LLPQLQLTDRGIEKFAKKLLGESEVEAILQRLDRLTQEEARMTVAYTLEVVHGLFDNLKLVMDGTERYSGGNQVIDETCSSRWQGIDGRHTASSRYVQHTWNTESF